MSLRRAIPPEFLADVAKVITHSLGDSGAVRVEAHVVTLTWRDILLLVLGRELRDSACTVKRA